MEGGTGSHSQSESDGIYWEDGTSQEEFWNAAAAVNDDGEGESTAEHNAGKGRPSADGRQSPRTFKRVKTNEGRDEPGITDKGKAKEVTLGSDDDQYWSIYPSSQIKVDEGIATQPSFEFSSSESRNTSMTSLESSSSEASLKRKRARLGLDPEMALRQGIPSFQTIHEGEDVGGVSSVPVVPAAAPVDPGCSTSHQAKGRTKATKYHIIAYDKEVQKRMDALNIAYGTQYEIARGITSGHWTWADVTEEKLLRLQGTNEEKADSVALVLCGKDAARNGDLWQELDREQDAILEGKDRGLGLQGEWKGHPNWYGGRIQQKMKMIRSHRFARMLGSRRIMQIKFPSGRRDIEEEHKLLAHNFVLCGRSFVPFSTKDGKVYLMETNEDYDGRTPLVCQGDQHRLSLEDFVNWHNSMELNKNQPVLKWLTRFDLGLSTSIPVLRFEPDNVIMLEDTCAPHSKGSKIPPEKIFTDGCGFMNGAALKQIALALGLPTAPTAVQGRIFGSKGLWVLHSYERSLDDEPKIWIRPSQVKINLVNPAQLPKSGKITECLEQNKVHPAHFIFDLVQPSRTTLGARLSRLTIFNLDHNGVPKNVFIELIKDGLEREIMPLMQWKGSFAMELLWRAVDKSTGSTNYKLQQFLSGQQRALGMSRRREVGEELDEVDDFVPSSPKSFTSRCYASGKPVQTSETVLDMLRAGFNPTTEEYLYNAMKDLIEQTAGNYVKKGYIPILDSAEAFIIPDPYNVLEEGEIHFISSQRLLDPLLHTNPTQILGNVLIYRNPARLPSDVQKVRAVSCKALERYIDVIVLPTKGPRSLASLLAGGDVDGDVAVLIWDQKIVDHFTNAPTNDMQRGFLERYFQPESNIHSVASVCKEVLSSPRDAQTILRRHLLSGHKDHRVGIYSKFHEILIYGRGYNDPETIRVGHMFALLLDARKSGLALRDEVYASDKRNYDRDPPPCMADTDWDPAESRNLVHLARSKDLGKFILDRLHDAAKAMQGSYLSRYDKLEKNFKHDADLLYPYSKFFEMPAFREEVQVVESYVDELRKRWKGVWRDDGPSDHSTSKKKADKKALDDQRKRAIIADFMQGPPPEQTRMLRAVGKLEEVAASYAYRAHNTAFAYNVAFRVLATMKANACGPSPTAWNIGAVMSISSSAARVLGQDTRADGNRDWRDSKF